MRGKRANTGRNSQKIRTVRKARSKSWLWTVLIFLFVWFLTGFPFARFYPQPIEVVAEVEAGAYGRLPSSWDNQLITTVDPEVLQWAQSQGLGEALLRGAVKAAALERDPDTGEPTPGTGLRISVFDLLALPGIESDLGTAMVNPYESNPTGHCLAWWEILKRVDLGPRWIAEQQAALRKIANSLDLDPYKIYGSCGAGALGFNQAMPDNWWNMMGAGFNPWDRELAAEFTARYFTRAGYFTRGRRAAVHAYNPGASEWSYVDPIINHADSLSQSYAEEGLADFEAVILFYDDSQAQSLESVEMLDVEMSVAGSSVNQLSIWPVNCPPGTWGFDVITPFQPTGHTGVDKMCPTGTAVKAAGPGVVEYAGYWPEESWWKAANLGYGYTVWILHGYVDGKPLFTVYAHNSELLVEAGQVVNAGDVIARSGSSGAGTGPHVHFEVRLGGGTRNGGTDDLARVWDPDSPQNPALWIGAGQNFVTDDLPVGVASLMTSDSATQAMTLELKSTPVLRLAMKIGDLRVSLGGAFLASQELASILEDASQFANDLIPQLDAINEVLAPLGLKIDLGLLQAIEKADNLVSIIEKGLSAMQSFDKFLTNLHDVFSQWAIAGQDREFGLDPLLNWRLYSVTGGDYGFIE